LIGFNKHPFLHEPTKKPLKNSGLEQSRIGEGQIPKQSTAFFRALAWVFLAARGNTTLQAHALATAMGAQCHAWQCWQRCCEFTIGFGNDFVAHGWLQIKNAKRY
jgi:hypothetical protein